MTTLLNDIRYGIRMLMKRPGLAAIALLTLALGIGANITVFSFVNAYLLRPLPFGGAERLVDFTGRHANFGLMSISYANYLDWRQQNQTFEQMACYRDARGTVKWPGETAVGKRLQIHRGRPESNTPWSEVVGVVGHVKHYGVDHSSRETIYLCTDQSVSDYMTLVVRARGDPLRLVAPIRQAVSQIDPDVPVYNVQTLQAIEAERSFMRRVTTVVVGGFALTALLLAALGIYGVMAYSVSRRTNEIGMRIALGACVADIICMVLRQGARLALIRVGIGLAGCLALNRLISSLLFGVTPYDPVTLLVVVAVLACAALLASHLPARRAAKIDPMEALRYE